MSLCLTAEMRGVACFNRKRWTHTTGFLRDCFRRQHRHIIQDQLQIWLLCKKKNDFIPQKQIPISLLLIYYQAETKNKITPCTLLDIFINHLITFPWWQADSYENISAAANWWIYRKIIPASQTHQSYPELLWLHIFSKALVLFSCKWVSWFYFGGFLLWASFDST